MNTDIDFELDVMGIIQTSEEIDRLAAEIDQQLSKYDALQALDKELELISTSPERVADIAIQCCAYGINVPHTANRYEVMHQITVACEDMNSVKRSLQDLLEKIIQQLRNFIGYSRVLSNKLSVTAKTGKLSNVLTVDRRKFEALIAPFYPQKELTSLLQEMQTVNYSQLIIDAPTFEEALMSAIATRIVAIGWTIKGDLVSKPKTTDTTKTLPQQGWEIVQLKNTADSLSRLIIRNITESNTMIKNYKRMIVAVKDNTADITKLRRQLVYFKKFSQLINQVYINVAQRLLVIEHRL
jgi:hypothetical protein